jgi:hypothetical protein
MNIGVSRIPNVEPELTDNEFSEKHNVTMQNISVVMQCAGISVVSLTILENSNKIVDVELELFKNLPKTNRELLELPRIILARLMASAGINKAVLTANEDDIKSMKYIWDTIESLIKAGKEGKTTITDNIVSSIEDGSEKTCMSNSCRCKINK